MYDSWKIFSYKISFIKEQKKIFFYLFSKDENMSKYLNYMEKDVDNAYVF